MGERKVTERERKDEEGDGLEAEKVVGKGERWRRERKRDRAKRKEREKRGEEER